MGCHVPPIGRQEPATHFGVALGISFFENEDRFAEDEFDFKRCAQRIASHNGTTFL